MDGVFADSTFDHTTRRGSIGIVVIKDGIVVDRFGEKIRTLNSDYAEAYAVQIAMERNPGEIIFTDSVYASKAMGATWISRNLNTEAHRIAVLTKLGTLSRQHTAHRG